ncbi:MAG: response regulator, partial [Pirellulaceae bacterium]
MTIASRMTALLVEDNATHAHLIRRHLAKAAENTVALHHVERLADAFQFLSQQPCDVVLLDLSLPDSHIHETLPKFLETNGEVPVVVLTSLDDLEFGTNAVQQGAQDYLVKSDLDGQLLLRSIRYAIERKKTQDKLESYAAELARSNEHLQGFAHTVAHEVKTPIHVVSMCLQLLRQQRAGTLDDEARSLVDDAMSAIRGMTELVNELLEFARVSSATDALGPVDLEAVFYQAYAMLRPALKQAGAVVN